MAIAFESGGSSGLWDADGFTTSLASAAFTTPGTNRFLVALIGGNGGLVLTGDTFTSANLTWAKRASAINTGANDISEIWTAPAASVVTSEVATFAVSGGHNFNRASLAILCFSGVSGVGNTAVSAAGATGGDPALSVTSAAAGSYIAGGLFYRSSGNDTAPDGNTTSLYDSATGGGFGWAFRGLGRLAAGSGAVTIGMAGDDVLNEWQMAGIELLATGGGGGGFQSALARRSTVTMRAGRLMP